MKNQPPLFDFAFFADFYKELATLATLAMHEDWAYKETSSNIPHPILNNYIHHTFKKVQIENKISIQGDSAVFNTGLVTENQEEIYALFEKNKRPGTHKQWFFKGFKKNSDRALMQFTTLPGNADYFEDPSDLIYDTRLVLRVNVDHIIIDNKTRFPAPLNNSSDHILSMILNGAIDDTKKRIKRNYKTAIPQYFKGKIQLLIPLCLNNKNKADLALAVEKETGTYRATTCLTLDMAINNARLIAKPDDEWLKP